jgi:hypothetical protein
MKLAKVTLGLILPLWLGVAFGASWQQEEKKPQEQPRQPQARTQEQPRQESHPQPQAQPRAQEQPRTQSQPKPQEQPRQPQPHAQEQPRQENRPQPQAQPRAQEQPRTQPQPRPEEQSRQPQTRAQEQPRPNENHAPSNSNPGRQEQARPSQPSENRGGGRETAGGRPQQNAQQRARSYDTAKRVPQAQERTIFQQRRASNWGADHRDWRSRGGYVGFRIPQARFGLYFGRAHYFHLWGLPMVYVGGYPEFQYRGYWFELLDPVPPDWALDWYQTDQVYIDWDPDYGGYYLYDASHPNESLAVEIAG